MTREQQRDLLIETLASGYWGGSTQPSGLKKRMDAALRAIRAAGFKVIGPEHTHEVFEAAAFYKDGIMTFEAISCAADLTLKK